MDEQTTIGDWKALTAKTLVVRDKASRLPIREIVDIFAQVCPHWSFRSITGGGHMAPLSRPDRADFARWRLIVSLYNFKIFNLNRLYFAGWKKRRLH